MTQQAVEKTIGKKVTTVLTFQFKQGDDFSAYDAAIAKLKELGVSTGSMQRGEPIGLAYGDVYISKWRNLGTDVLELDGLLIADQGSMREGNVTVYLADKPAEG